MSNQIFLTAYKIGASRTKLTTPKVISINPANIEQYKTIPASSTDSRFIPGTTKLVLGGDGVKYQVYGVYETVEQIQVAIDPSTTNPYAQDMELGIDATGANQGAAFALTKYLNEVDGGTASSADGVKLPTAVANKVVVIINNVTFALDVWPDTSDTVAGGAADANTTQAAGTRKHYVAVDATDWVLAE